HFLQSKEEFPEENCTWYKCSLNIPVPAEGSTYCVSAQGSLYGGLMIGAPSEKSCIYVPLKQTLSTQDVVILCGVILSMSLILTVCCGCKKLRKKNIKLPKSLVSVIRNLNTDNMVESKSEAKYASIVTIMPGHERASLVPPPEATAKAEKVPVQESTKEVSSGDEQNCKVKESYSISDSGQMDICSNSSGSEVSATEMQQTVISSTCLKFSGYDKPHVPLDMLIDVGEEQPVIAYRLTD
ncbi:INGR1 protein, partial [Sula dactylatra]|nr:INGR1 protein [Sula dactylatra]